MLPRLFDKGDKFDRKFDQADRWSLSAMLSRIVDKGAKFFRKFDQTDRRCLSCGPAAYPVQALQKQTQITLVG